MGFKGHFSSSTCLRLLYGRFLWNEGFVSNPKFSRTLSLPRQSQLARIHTLFDVLGEIWNSFLFFAYWAAMLLFRWLVSCLSAAERAQPQAIQVVIINQLFTSAQPLLPLILGLHVSTDHSVIFRSLICCKFQGAVHTFGIPIVFELKLNPFISVGGWF